jgi:outer membrane protein OmpA-like peptidoglycan-associated protein
MPLASGMLQRKCACGKAATTGGECEACAGKRQCLQRVAMSDSATAAGLASVPPVLRAPGVALDAGTRDFMETRFGRDFSHVRIHADGRAAASAEALDARAYTVGADIVFGRGEYRPQTHAGRRLLAHELAHTVQQGRFAGAVPPAHLEIGPLDTPLEREADRAAEQVTAASPSPSHAGTALAGTAAPTLSRAPAGLQRQPKKTKEPLIPIPVFDELDPMIIVPDVPGVPSILRGREVKLSTLRSALDVLRGNLPSLGGGTGEDFCTRLIPGYETAHGGDVDGLCCPRFVRDRDRCCRWQDVGMMSFRCCGPDEVVISDRCVRPERAPIPPPPLPSAPVPSPAPGGLTFPTIPRLEMEFPRGPFGTIQSDTIDHFALDRDALPSTPAATEALDRLARQLQLYREAEVHVEGHTDSSASEQHNQSLSERRARAVRDALVQRGVDRRRIIVQGFGETRLLFPGERTEEEKARNRRVDVWFYIPPSRGLGEGLQRRPPSLTGPGEGAP